jgi:ribonuclease VapC
LIAVDTSALAAIFLKEPDRETFMHAIFGASSAVIAAPSAFEFLLVARSRHPNQAAAAWEILHRSGLTIVPWTETHVSLAQDAFLRFGKGSGHGAGLNFGDCMSYALAKSLDVPLLFKGNDFRRTDIRAAI